MAFLVEDGTGVINATSYVSVEFADEWVDNFLVNDGGWSALDEAVKEKLLMNAASYLDTMLSWNSILLNAEQGLAFPRVPFTDKEGRSVVGVPNLIKEANIKLAIEANSKPLETPVRRLKAQQWGSGRDEFSSAYEEGNGTISYFRNVLIVLGFGVSTLTGARLARS